MQEKGVTEEDYDKIPEPVNPARHRTKVEVFHLDQIGQVCLSQPHLRLHYED